MSAVERLDDQDALIALPRDVTLVLLHHKFRREVFLTIEAAQHGHRDMVLTSATIN